MERPQPEKVVKTALTRCASGLGGNRKSLVPAPKGPGTQGRAQLTCKAEHGEYWENTTDEYSYTYTPISGKRGQQHLGAVVGIR